MYLLFLLAATLEITWPRKLIARFPPGKYKTHVENNHSLCWAEVITMRLAETLFLDLNAGLLLPLSVKVQVVQLANAAWF